MVIPTIIKEEYKMKTINLCGRPAGCCPSIQEDKKTGIMYIVDGDQKIALNKEHRQKLAVYLNGRSD